MGAVKERSLIDLAAAKKHLRVKSDAFDVIIQNYLDAAKDKADDFCNNAFVDADGVALPIPGNVENFVLTLVGRLFDNPDNGLQMDQTAGVGNLNWGDIDYSMIEGKRLNPGL